jgi:SAM-dependent methyltransferase
LDFGCGGGNVTRHLQTLGFAVTAADVTPAFLEIVAERFGVETLLLPGGDMSVLPDAAYDLITVYSVLHHIPDYLGTVQALVRKLRCGGVLFIDHERTDNYWVPDQALRSYRHALSEAGARRYWDPDRRRWQHLVRAAVVPSRHLARVRKWRGLNDEGDIHVYQDDHIQWERVRASLEESGADVVARDEYLHFAGRASEAVWTRWRDRCADMGYVIARRRET